MATVRKEGSRYRVGRSPVKFKTKAAAQRFAGNAGKGRKRKRRRSKGR